MKIVAIAGVALGAVLLASGIATGSSPFAVAGVIFLAVGILLSRI